MDITTPILLPFHHWYLGLPLVETAWDADVLAASLPLENGGELGFPVVGVRPETRPHPIQTVVVTDALWSKNKKMLVRTIG